MRSAAASSPALMTAWTVLIRELRSKVGFVAPGLSFATFADRLVANKDAVWDTFVELHAGCAEAEAVTGYVFEHAADHSSDLPFEKPFDEWSERERRWGNIEAFRVLRRVADSEVGLSDADRQLLTAWSGWGGIRIEDVPLDPEVFTDDYMNALAEWRGLRKRGGTSLPEGYVPKSPLLLNAVNQFFTPMGVCAFMWRLAERAASTSGLAPSDFQTVLEPSAGSGRFLASKPSEGPLAGVQWTTVELDNIGSGVIRGAYPDHEHYHTTFERVASAGIRQIKLFDMIIGNPPYPARMSSDRLDDPDLSHYDLAHTYFVRRCADLLKPGGIMVMLTPLGQIHAERKARPEMVAFRRDMLTFCDFLGGAAIPADVFPGATLNLAVHVWRKKLPRAYRVPSTVSGAPVAVFLEGKYFQQAAPSNLLGEWQASTRYKDSYILTGPFAASMAETVVLDDAPIDGADLRDIAVLRAAYRDPGLLKITGAAESLANKLRRQSREVGDVSIDGLILLRARNLSSRVERYLSLLSSDPTLARVGRGELLMDIQALLAIIDSPWAHPMTSSDAGCHWLREVVTPEGRIAAHITDGDDGQERPRAGTTFASADEAIRWYSSRTGRCTGRDLVRHGYSEEDGLTAAETSPDIAIMPALSATGEMDFQRKSEFLAPKGSTWDLLDQVGQLRTDDRLSDSARACYNRQFVWLTEHLQPVPLSEIRPEPRSPFVTEDVLSAFASWWLRDATPGGTSQAWSGENPYVLFPGVRMVKTNEVWTAYPARLMRTGRDRRGNPVYKLMTSEEAAESLAAPQEWLVPADERQAAQGKRFVVQWEPLPPIQELGSVTWANYWDVLGPSVEEIANSHQLLYGGQSYLHGHGWVKEWRGTRSKSGAAEDRYYVLMGHLNQTNRVAKLGGSQDRMLSKLVLVEGFANEAVLTDAFIYWLTMNQWAADKVVSGYNRTFRGMGAREYPGDELTIYRRLSAGSQINLLPYQWSTCRRMADTLSCIAALDVGFGKTFTGIAGIALARQNGLIRRAVVKVPPSVTTNWYTEASRLLPDYMVVVIGYTPTAGGQWREDTAEERAAKWRGYARGLGDLLIVPETKWADDVAMTADSIIQVFQNAYVSRRAIARGTAEIATLTQKIEHARREIDEARSAGAYGKAEDLGKRLGKLEAKLEELTKKAGKEDQKATGRTIYTLARKLDAIRTTQPFRPTRAYSPWSPTWSVDRLISTMEKAEIPVPDVPEGATTAEYHALLVAYMQAEVPTVKGTIVVPHLITWEELDVDCLMIDEAHRDKNIMGPEAREKVEFLGAPPGDTRSALDTWLRCQWLLQRYGRGVMLLTATPLKNSPLELYNLLSLVDPRVWTSRGVGDPDSFIARYLRIEDDITITARGVPEPRRVVAGFMHLTELREITRALMERRTTEDLIAYWTSIGQLDVYRRNFPDVAHHTLNADLDDIQARIFEPIRAYLLAGSGVAGRDAQGNCIVLSGMEREAARSKVIADRRSRNALTLMERVLDTVEQDDPGRFALMLKDILEKAALDPRLLEAMRVNNLAELPKARERINKALEAFVAEDRRPPAQEEVAELLHAAWGIAQDAVGYERDDDTGAIVGSVADSAAGVGAGGVMAKKALDPLTRRLLAAVRAEAACFNAVVLVDAILYSAAGLDSRDRDFDEEPDTSGAVIENYLGESHVTLADDLETPEGFQVTALFTQLYEATDLHPPKMLAVANKIAEGGERSPTKGTLTFKCASIIFAEYTSIHGWLISALVAAGIPRHRIAVMDGSVPIQRRQTLANEFTGTATSPRIYDVLIANSVAYEGMNLQRETCAVFHLDLPWEPASMHQREGRAVRQGNLWGRVDVYTVLSPGTLDPFKYGIVEGKRAWQEEFYNGSDEEMDNPDKDAAKVTREELVANLVFYKEDPESVEARTCLLQHVRRIREAKKRQQLLKRLQPTIAALQASAAALATAVAGGDTTLISLARDSLHRPASALRTLGAILGQEHTAWIEELIESAYQGPIGFAWAPRVADPKDIRDYQPVIYRVGDVVVFTSFASPELDGVSQTRPLVLAGPTGSFTISCRTLEEGLEQLTRTLQDPTRRWKRFSVRLLRVYPTIIGQPFGELEGQPYFDRSAQPDRALAEDGKHRTYYANVPLTNRVIGAPLAWDEAEHITTAIAALLGRGIRYEKGQTAGLIRLGVLPRPSIPTSVLEANRETILLTLAGVRKPIFARFGDGLADNLHADLVGPVSMEDVSRSDVPPLVLRRGDTFYLGWPHELVRSIRYKWAPPSAPLDYDRMYPTIRTAGVHPAWLAHVYLGAPEPGQLEQECLFALQANGTLRPADPTRQGFSIVFYEDGMGPAFSAAFGSGKVRILESTWTLRAATQAPTLPRGAGEARPLNLIVPDLTDRPMVASDLRSLMVASSGGPFVVFQNSTLRQIGSRPTSVDLVRLQRRLGSSEDTSKGVEE